MTTTPTGTYDVYDGDALDAYPNWPTPALIMSDGAYGVGGFPGDPKDAAEVPEWYRPHIEAWSAAAGPATTLWFWNTEVGWANTHPLLVANGWEYQGLHVWDKGIGQVAGNVNSRTIRRFPVVTEVCAFYSRKLVLPNDDGTMPVQPWLRAEWQRAGLALSKTNEACGVKNAATRKYFTADHLWYFPPGVAIEQLAAYATEHGPDTKRPYFSIDGVNPPTAKDWDALRYAWEHQHGLTNVWSLPSLRGAERIKGKAGNATTHLNQKPLALMRRILTAATQPGDVVWEPFGGLCSGTLAAFEMGRSAYAAEVIPAFREVALERLAALTRVDEDIEVAGK